MKHLIIGAEGQVGEALCESLKGSEIYAASRSDMNLTLKHVINKKLKNFQVDLSFFD